MSNINTKLETLRAAQAALREAFYDFQDALLDRPMARSTITM